MTIVRVGATKKYADGWEGAFGGSKGKKQGKPTKAKKSVNKPAKASAKKKPAGRKAKKK